jgi:hypothetical protein
MGGLCAMIQVLIRTIFRDSLCSWKESPTVYMTGCGKAVILQGYFTFTPGSCTIPKVLQVLSVALP